MGAVLAPESIAFGLVIATSPSRFLQSAPEMAQAISSVF
jgi:hypothetical protein